MSNLNIHFNYKHEHRRAWLYLVAPMVLTVVGLFINMILFEEKSYHPVFPLMIYYKSLHIIRNFLWIANLYPMTIFARNLYDRFDALNNLIRSSFTQHSPLTIEYVMVDLAFIWNVGNDFLRTVKRNRWLTFEKGTLLIWFNLLAMSIICSITSWINWMNAGQLR